MISRSLDGDLGPYEAEEMASHLAGCDGCRRVLEHYTVQRDLVSASFSDRPVPVGVTASLALLTEVKNDGRRLCFSRLMIAGACLTVLVALGATLYFYRAPQPEQLSSLVIFEGGDPSSMSYPLGSLVYYEEFAGQGVCSQFVKIAPQPTEAADRTDQQAVRAVFYNSPLFDDQTAQDRRSGTSGGKELR